MSQGKVTVNNLNLGQGDFPEIERKVLIIGVGAKNIGSVLSINSQSDLNDLLGVANTAGGIKLNVQAALANGGENIQIYAAPIAANDDWQAAVDRAMLVTSVELIAVCVPVTGHNDLEAAQTKMESLRTSRARRCIALMATPGIDALTQTWAAYETAQAAITALVAAYRVAAVPQLHGNDLGALVGRLCNRSVTIADTPMRVKTGPMLGLGVTPVDKDGVALTSATLKTLDENRLSVIQHYADYAGVYFGDCNLLDAAGGDYQVIENLRVVDKVCRAVRILAIADIGDRALNNSSSSIATAKNRYAKPMRDMSKSAKIGEIIFPGEIEPPNDDAVTIIWPERTRVEIYIKVRPYECPKDITANIFLDLADA